jgi:hypothetical protein
MPVPTWVSWQVLTPYVIAIPGWIALWKTWRSERVVLRFVFNGFPKFEYRDPEDGSESITPALLVTVTNDGKCPVTVERLTCETYFAGQKRTDSKQNSAQIYPVIVLRQGEACSQWIPLRNLQMQFACGRFVSLTALDTTGRKWKPNRSERKNLHDQEAKIWVPKMPVRKSN